MDTQIVYEQLQYTVWRVSYSNQIPSRYAQNRIWADTLKPQSDWVVGWFWSCLLGQFVWHITKNFCVCFWTFIVNTFDTPVGNFIFFTPGNKCSELLTPLSHHLIFTPSAGKFGALLFMLFKTYLGPFFCSWHTTGSLTTSKFKFKSNHSTEWNTFCAWKLLQLKQGIL